MLFQHQAVVGKHRAHQIVNALARLQQALEGHVAEIVVPKLADFFLRDERCGRADLPIIADDQDFLAAQQGRQPPPAPFGLRGASSLTEYSSRFCRKFIASWTKAWRAEKIGTVGQNHSIIFG